MKAIDLNCDLGESFGAYTIGQDRALMEVITSASVACGFHAGDPTVMGRTPETLFSLTEQGESRFLLSPGDRVRFVAVPPEAFREGASAV